MSRGTVGSRRPKPRAAKAPPPVGHPASRDRLAAFRIVHPFPSVLVAGLTVALALLAGGREEWRAATQLGVAMLLYQFSIGVTNDIADEADDAINKPWKPLPRGALTRRAAVLLAGVCAGGGMVLTFSLPFDAWLVGLAGLGCGLAYDVALKRTALSWLPYSIAIPLVPVWVHLALGAWRPFLWWVLPLGALLGLSLHFANQLPDVDGDRSRGIDSAVQRAGVRRTYGVSVGALGVAMSIAVVALLFEDAPRSALVASDGVLTVVLAPRATRFFGRDGLFGVVAVASAVLAVLFLSAV